ncbi:hypothetical protein KGY79_02800, partial [Candidatus Bipolaricaulota bacterium]|nr:hypothetical protein [Candidatus Bipolaricaulota bacterium]
NFLDPSPFRIPQEERVESEPRSERAISPLGKLIPGFIERFPKRFLHIKCYTILLLSFKG